MEAPLAMVTAKVKANPFTHRTTVNIRIDLADGTHKAIATLWVPDLREIQNTNEISLCVHDEEGNARGIVWVQNIERDN